MILSVTENSGVSLAMTCLCHLPNAYRFRPVRRTTAPAQFHPQQRCLCPVQERSGSWHPTSSAGCRSLVRPWHAPAIVHRFAQERRAVLERDDHYRYAAFGNSCRRRRCLSGLSSHPSGGQTGARSESFSQRQTIGNAHTGRYLFLSPDACSQGRHSGAIEPLSTTPSPSVSSACRGLPVALTTSCRAKRRFPSSGQYRKWPNSRTPPSGR